MLSAKELVDLLLMTIPLNMEGWQNDVWVLEAQWHESCQEGSRQLSHHPLPLSLALDGMLDVCHQHDVLSGNSTHAVM